MKVKNVLIDEYEYILTDDLLHIYRYKTLIKVMSIWGYSKNKEHYWRRNKYHGVFELVEDRKIYKVCYNPDIAKEAENIMYAYNIEVTDKDTCLVDSIEVVEMTDNKIVQEMVLVKL